MSPFNWTSSGKEKIEQMLVMKRGTGDRCIISKRDMAFTQEVGQLHERCPDKKRF